MRAVTDTNDPLADLRAAFRAARIAATDAALDIRLATDAPNRALTHPFVVLETMAAWMARQVDALHAIDRLVNRANELGGLEPDSSAELAESRRGMVEGYEQIRTRAIEILVEMKAMPTYPPPAVRSSQSQ